MSSPPSSTRPAVGETSPEMRLNSDVFPAPFGPMMATSSPARASSVTSSTMRAPPMCSPRPRVARIGVPSTMDPIRLLLLLGWRDVLRLERLRGHAHPLVALLHELREEVRLEHGVVGGPD